MRLFKHAAVLAILFAIAFAIVRNKVSHEAYYYDEADYLFAASLGIGPNWVDAGTMPLTEFVSAGRRQGADSSQQAGLSALARSGADPVVYRHWHGPLYYYWLTIPSRLGLDEHATRSLSFLFPLLTVLAIYCGSLFVMPGIEGEVAGILGSAMVLWSPVTLETSEVAPHLLFVLCCVCGLMLLAKVAMGGGRRYYYAAVVCAGLAFCTMEITFVLILTLLIVAWWQRETLRTDWRLARNSLGILVATILAVWPTGLLKLSFAKAYMVMAYLAIFRKGAWGNVTFTETWARRFAVTPVEWVLIGVAVVAFFVMGRRREWGVALTFLIFGVLMILATLRVYAEGPRYMTPFFAALELFAAWALAAVLVRLGRQSSVVYAATAAVCCLLAWNSQRQLSGYLLHENLRPLERIHDIGARGLAEKSVLMPRLNIPTMHYYYPLMKIEGYTDVSEIPAKDTGQFDAVMNADYSLRAGDYRTR